MLTQRLHRPTAKASLAAALVCVLIAPSATLRADYVAQTVILDQSNKLADGVNYGSVKIEAYDGKGAAGGGLAAGQVRITYTPNIVPAYGTVSSDFGFSAVNFNTDLALTNKQITIPKGWAVSSPAASGGFGTFNWGAQDIGKNNKKQNPMTILISGLGTDATLSHFLLPSVGGKNQGTATFAGQVQSINTGRSDTSETHSHWIAGSAVLTPEPGTLAMCGAAAVSLLLTRRRKPAQA
jgi:hypothetical protein